MDLKRMMVWVGATVMLLGSSTGLATAQESAGTADAPPPSSPPPAAAKPKVVAVESDVAGHPNRAGLGDRLTVQVEHLDTLIAAADGECENIVLFLGGLPLPNLEPERCDPDDSIMGFHLRRSAEATGEAADATWHALLGRPMGFDRRVEVTVGPTAHRSIPTAVRDFRLIVLPKREFYLFLVLFIAILVLFWRLASTSDLLRDSGVEARPGERRPYSLSRFQMAFWSLLVVGAYLFIWMVTGELDTITESVLALIGIGSGTALGATLVDSSKRQTMTTESGRLEGEKKALEDMVAKLDTESGASDEKLVASKARLAAVDHQLATATEPVKSASTGSFLRDVLGDSQGISIHRFQMFVWTLILGVIFCASVYKSLAMPQFSATLLGLMGISSGTYLGFKFPERYAAPPSAAPTQPGET